METLQARQRKAMGAVAHGRAGVEQAQGTLTEAEAMLGYAVRRARAQRVSWQKIADVLGISKQAVQKRYALRDEDGYPLPWYEYKDRDAT